MALSGAYRPNVDPFPVRVSRPPPLVGPPVAGPIEVVLADDHDVMRGRLRRVLDEDATIHVIADTGDLGEAIRLVFCIRPTVLVLDMSMAGGSTIDAVRLLRRHIPGTAIVVMKMEVSVAFALHAFEAGASGYAVKDTADAELVEAVRCASRRERYVSPRLGAAL